MVSFEQKLNFLCNFSLFECTNTHTLSIKTYQELWAQKAAAGVAAEVFTIYSYWIEVQLIVYQNKD